MKTKQQIAESIYSVLQERIGHPEARAFHSDARLREDLALDSSSILQLLVLLELEFGVDLPEQAVMDQDFDTVRSVTKLLFDAQEPPHPGKILDYEEDIKLHCFVSCLSEVLKRARIDQRVLYFGVWDSEIVVADDYVISYHSESIRHDFFVEWFQRLYGIEMREWYRPQLNNLGNVRRLIELVEARTPGQHVMVMLDMHRLPERVNEFNKDPFPHYVMLGKTTDPDLWMMYDPDYRWEGVLSKERILRAMDHPSVGGGYVFSEANCHPPEASEIIAYYEACMQHESNPMTAAIRKIVAAHVTGRSEEGRPLALSQLGSALVEVPILSIRKYAYEHGLAFFFRELGLGEDEFDSWCDLIADLVKTFKVVQFQSLKLAATADQRIADKIFTLLDEQDAREARIKARLHDLYSRWCDVVVASSTRKLASGAPR